MRNSWSLICELLLQLRNLNVFRRTCCAQYVMLACNDMFVDCCNRIRGWSRLYQLSGCIVIRANTNCEAGRLGSNDTALSILTSWCLAGMLWIINLLRA